MRIIGHFLFDILFKICGFFGWVGMQIAIFPLWLAWKLSE